MAKVKIKCASCGKSFKSPDAKRTLCPECQAARKAKPAGATPATPAAPAAPAIDVRAAFLAAQQAAGDYAAYRAAPPPPELPAAAPPAPREAGAAPEPFPRGRPGPGLPGPRPRVAPAARVPKAPRPAPPPPRPTRPRKEPTPPFMPTAEQQEAIRQRYLELAQPEYDGIRHQIAHELAMPIRVVKEVVKELRTQMSLPSWWELAAASLTDEQRAAVRDLYLPQLPLPEVGIHKRIAEQLGLKPLAVYSAIRTVREEAGLPRYNDRPDRVPPGAPDTAETSPAASETTAEDGEGERQPEADLQAAGTPAGGEPDRPLTLA